MGSYMSLFACMPRPQKTRAGRHMIGTALPALQLVA